MDDHTNHNLDDFFREAFDDDHYLSSDEGWDMPSNQVWTNIESSLITPISGLFISRLSASILSTTALMLLLAMTYFMYQFKQEVQESKQEIQDLKQVIARNNVILAELKSSLLAEKTIDHSKQSLEENMKTSTLISSKKTEGMAQSIISNSLSPKQSKKNTPTFTKKKRQKTAILQQIQQDNATAISTTPQFSIFALNNETISFFNEARKTISLLNSEYISQQLPLFGLQTKTTVLKDHNFSNFNSLSPRNLLDQVLSSQKNLVSITPPIPVKKNKVGGRWSIGVFDAPTWHFQSNSTHNNNSTPSPHPTENTKSWKYQSSSIGTKLAWHFSSHFSIETGFNYLKVQKRQEVRHRLEYTDDDIQIMQNGDEQIHLAIPFMTDFGNTLISFEANRDEHNHGGGGHPDHSHHEHINLCFDTDQTLSLGTIPLFLKYKTIGHKVRFTAKAGIAHQFLLRGRLNLSDIALKDRDWRLSHHENFRTIDLKGKINSRWSYTTGIGLEAMLNSRVTLAVEPTFTRSMQPILENNEEKFYPMFFQTDIGLNYYF